MRSATAYPFVPDYPHYSLLQGLTQYIERRYVINDGSIGKCRRYGRLDYRPTNGMLLIDTQRIESRFIIYLCKNDAH